MNQSKEKKIRIYYFVFSLLILIIAYYINIDFRDKLLTISLSKSIFWLTAPITLFSFVCLFLKQGVFKIWSKITLIYLTVSIIIILLSPNSTHGMDIYPATKENLTIVLASVYSFISLILAIYYSFKKDTNLI